MDPFFSAYSSGKPSVFCSLQFAKNCEGAEGGACDEACKDHIDEAIISVSCWMVMVCSCATRTEVFPASAGGACPPPSVASLADGSPVAAGAPPLPDMCDERVAEGQANAVQVATC